MNKDEFIFAIWTDALASKLVLIKRSGVDMVDSDLC